jgi:putative ATP-dependent endonuclease of the OLD family
MHPLEGFRFRFPNFKGFAAEPGDWIEFQPITVVVGRNNTGKSAIIDALRVVLSGKKAFRDEYHRAGQQASFDIESHLGEPDLRQVFRENHSSGGVPGGNDWMYGRDFVGSLLVRSFDGAWSPRWVDGPDLNAINSGIRDNYASQIMERAAVPKGTLFHIAAERNVRPEPQADAQIVEPSGEQLTNLVRAFLYDARLPMREVEQGLLSDLNEIYRGDTEFARILCRQEGSAGRWEIYLTEKGGVPIRLSQSGSSLKSIFIILATIRLNPIVARESSLENNVFCVEEPENNLHPALLRRLLDFLSTTREGSNSSLLITTHSATAIDWATRRGDATTYHVCRGPGGAVAQEAKEYRALRSLLHDLDIRASEILQANGVVWVEGPSDRLYVRKWLELGSAGALKEGVHYSTMFYGGKLLSHLSSLPPAEVEEAISLLRLNRNLALLIDSDRRRLRGGRFRAELNATKRRLIAETESIGGYVWVTHGKEIENYLHSDLLRALSDGHVRHVDDYDSVPTALGQFIGDKISLAHSAMALVQPEHLEVNDLAQRVQGLCAEVMRWNSL